MALANGSKLGPYEIVAPLGAGGMGEVYRARDARLGRDVAIKLLPDAFADDPERLARFEREAKLLASLQHANIAVLHGLEESDGRRYLVMQCVEGESLAQRLARGPLPQAETLEITVAIAAALEAAHESGIVHRDLKPGNVMVTPAGEVRVLDFGLAKGGAGSSSDVGLSASPTRTAAATSAGVVLGTAAYMSPEQARGKPVDRRTDIWSFGCVLFECLTGQQAFSGETVSDIVARILQTEPEWSLLPAGTPGRLRDLLVRCLQKDARRRLRDIGDARIELEDLIAGRVSASGAHLATATTAPARPAWMMVAGAIAIAAAAWFASRAFAPAPESAGVVRFSMQGPHEMTLRNDAAATVISPDGQSIALIADDSSGVSHLWIRRMDSMQPRLLPGTDRVTQMFWSPDSRSLGFFAIDRQLLRIAIAGGEPERICDVKSARGGDWNEQGVILFAPYSNGAIYRVSMNGGEPVAVVHPDSAHGETGVRFPRFLPDGRHFLFSSLPADSSGTLGIYAGSLDGGERRLVLRAESGAEYVAPGWLVYTRRAQLIAQRFDARSLRTSGEPVLLGDIVSGSSFTGMPLVSASRSGTLAFTAFNLAPERLAWFGLDGQLIANTSVPAGLYFGPRVSPDGHRVILASMDEQRAEFVSIADLDRGVISTVSAPEDFGTYPCWAPDGERYAYMVDGGAEPIIVRSTLDDSRRVLGASDHAYKRPQEWSHDGRWLIFDRLDPATKWDVCAMPLDGGPTRILANTPANDQFGSVSPDGHWLAFQSDASGSPEVYVLPFGSTGMRYQVTNGGGLVPSWSADSRRLRFGDPKRPNVVMEADVKAGTSFSVGTPRVLARLPETTGGFDLDPTGTRTLVTVPAEAAQPITLTVVQGWMTGLKKR